MATSLYIDSPLRCSCHQAKVYNARWDTSALVSWFESLRCPRGASYTMKHNLSGPFPLGWGLIHLQTEFGSEEAQLIWEHTYGPPGHEVRHFSPYASYSLTEVHVSSSGGYHPQLVHLYLNPELAPNYGLKTSDSGSACCVIL